MSSFFIFYFFFFLVGALHGVVLCDSAEAHGTSTAAAASTTKSNVGFERKEVVASSAPDMFTPLNSFVIEAKQFGVSKLYWR